MPNVINATTGGIVSTGDSTATLDIQTGGTNAISINATQDVTMANGDLNVSGGSVSDSAGNVRSVPQSGSDKTTSYTLATSDVGEFVGVGSGGSITIPDSTFTAGDVVSVFNNTSGDVTITCTITTAYIAGTDSDKATVTLATRGVATILFLSSTVCVITGNVS
jgi:hypothetical protein